MALPPTDEAQANTPPAVAARQGWVTGRVLTVLVISVILAVVVMVLAVKFA